MSGNKDTLAIDNSTAGMADAYWYEWYVGLDNILDMLNTKNNIDHVILQHEKLQGLDDVVVIYTDKTAKCIQVKHTRTGEKISFSDLVYFTQNKESLLKKTAKDWLRARELYGECNAILYTNRKAGSDYEVKMRNMNNYIRPDLKIFYETLKIEISKMNELKQFSENHQEWDVAWNEWCTQLECIKKESDRIEFIKCLKIKTEEKDLKETVESVVHKLEESFDISNSIARQLEMKLCYALRTWTTSLRQRQEITKEKLYEALSINDEEEIGVHDITPQEPIFKSRTEFANNLSNTLAKREKPVIFLNGEPGCGKTNVVSDLAQRSESVISLRFYTFKPLTLKDNYLSPDGGIYEARSLWGNLLIGLRRLLKGNFYLMFIKSLKDILEHNLIGCDVAPCNMYFGMYKWMKVYNIEKIDECGNVNKGIYRLSHLVRAYLTNQHIDMNRYNSIIGAHISEEKEYLNKIDLGFYELELYMNRRLLQKAINIAGSTGNIKDFRKNLIKGKFNDEQCHLLQQYYVVMRYKYLKSIGHKDDEKIMQYANYYPLSIVEKVIPKQILEKAKKIAKDSFDEAIYKKRLKKVFNDDMQQRILMQCYNSFRVEDNKKILISRQNNKVNRTHDFKSNNAIIAENNGLFTLQHLDDDRLKKYGFNYRLDFFRWLCSINFIAPKEIHHVGPEARSTAYYDNSTITYVVEHYDLEFLYRIFSKEIDYMQALDEKGISFCYVEANRELIGLRSGDPVKVYCVRQKNMFWFSKQKYIKLNGNNIRILSECKYPEKEFSNVNYQKVIKMLLSRKKIKLIRNLI